MHADHARSRPGGLGRRTWQWGLVLAVVGLVAGTLGPVRPATAGEPAGSPMVTGWLPSWATTAAIEAVEDNADLIGAASPFWYQAKAGNGAVTLSTSAGESTRTSVLARLRARGVEVIPSVADGSAARAMAGILKSSSARATHVQQLVDLVTANGYDGIELDYEKFAFSDGSSTWAQTRPAWVAFVTELGAALHERGRKLALAVPPMYDGTYSSSSGYWVYDYAGIAPAVDSLRIMTYDYSVSRPGPIAPLAFLRRTLSYAVTAFPADRIRMGMPAYGRLWTARGADGSPAITGTCPTSGVPGTTSFTTTTARSHLQAVAGQKPDYRYDAATAERVATFSKEYSGVARDGGSTSCVVEHEAWWVDARGIAERMPLVQEYGLAGVAIWHLGGVDDPSWSAIRDYTSGAPVQAPPLLSPPEPEPTLVTPKVKVKPSTTRPRRGAKVTFRVKVTPARKSVQVKRKMRLRGEWVTMTAKRTNAKGRVTFSFRWPDRKMSRTYKVTTRKRGSLGPGRSTTFRLRTR